jgi:hypothetical protein
MAGQNPSSPGGTFGAGSLSSVSFPSRSTARTVRPVTVAARYLPTYLPTYLLTYLALCLCRYLPIRRDPPEILAESQVEPVIQFQCSFHLNGQTHRPASKLFILEFNEFDEVVVRVLLFLHSTLGTWG